MRVASEDAPRTSTERGARSGVKPAKRDMMTDIPQDYDRAVRPPRVILDRVPSYRNHRGWPLQRSAPAYRRPSAGCFGNANTAEVPLEMPHVVRSRFLSAPLETQQVQRSRLPYSGDRQSRMHLPPMMCLVIEEMRQRRPQFLLEGLSAGVLVTDRLAVSIKFGDKIEDPFVFAFPRSPQFGEILVQNLVQPLGNRAIAGESPHPDVIRHQQMVQRVVHAAEEQSHGALSRLIRQ